MNPPADFNAENWLARSLAARSAKALSALTRAELQLALDEARAELRRPLATLEAASLLEHVNKIQAAGYEVGEPFRPEQPEPPMPRRHKLAAVRAGGGLRSGEEAVTRFRRVWQATNGKRQLAVMEGGSAHPSPISPG